MKKLFLVLFMSFALLVGSFAIPFGASKASAAPVTYTVKYGQHSILNQGNGATLWGFDYSYANLKMNTYFTASQSGIVIDKITQSATGFYPVYSYTKGTSIINKKSSSKSQTAHSYAKFLIQWRPGSKIIPIGGSKNWEYHTYIKVTKIDKTKKTVTFQVENKRL